MRGSITYIHSTCCEDFVSFIEEYVSSLECPLREGPLYLVLRFGFHWMPRFFIKAKHVKLTVHMLSFNYLELSSGLDTHKITYQYLV